MSSPATARALPHESLVVPTSAPIGACANGLPDPQHGDVTWLQSILDQFEGPLLRYAQRITGNLELARDVVQETFLRACREDRTKLDDPARWLFRVCRNRALDVQRKEQRMLVAADLDLRSLPGETGPDDLLAARETNSRLLGLLEGLPANQQEVIRLKFQNDLKYREIADITGQSIANVGFLLHTGLKRLRELMKDS